MGRGSEGGELYRRHVKADAIREQFHRHLLQPADQVSRHVVDHEIAFAQIGVTEAPRDIWSRHRSLSGS
jgi:hypothetical protein